MTDREVRIKFLITAYRDATAVDRLADRATTVGGASVHIQWDVARPQRRSRVFLKCDTQDELLRSSLHLGGLFPLNFTEDGLRPIEADGVFVASTPPAS